LGFCKDITLFCQLFCRHRHSREVKRIFLYHSFVFLYWINQPIFKSTMYRFKI
jgi:hypothetical protein